MSSFLLLTGMPGSGKTTMIKRLISDLKKTQQILNVQGFYTEELRNANNQRIGFDAVTFDGNREPLARVSSEIKPENAPATGSAHKVGKYIVYAQEFENLAMSLLEPKNENLLLVIDEIGKMELISKRFEEFIKQLLVSTDNRKIIATIPLKNPSNLINKLKSHQNSLLFHITQSNRTEVYKEVLEAAKK